MTAKQFEAVKQKLPKRMKEQSIDLARDVLVDGLSIPAAAEKQGLTRERGRVIVDRVLAAKQAFPPGMQHVDVFLPPELAREVKRMGSPASVGKDRMTLEQFEAVKQKLPKKMKPQSIELAHDVLVDGLAIAEAAERYELTRQRGVLIVNRVLATAQGAPASWKRVSVLLSPEDARKVKRMHKKAVAEADAARQQDRRRS